MKILIELPTWLGDTVMVTPAIENIVNYYNEPEITIVGSFISNFLPKSQVHHSRALPAQKKPYCLLLQRGR